MKVFFQQPALPCPRSSAIMDSISNWGKLNEWMKGNPSLELLKAAALVEGNTRKRIPILNRLLTRIYKMEKINAMNLLTK